MDFALPSVASKESSSPVQTRIQHLLDSLAKFGKICVPLLRIMVRGSFRSPVASQAHSLVSSMLRVHPFSAHASSAQHLDGQVNGNRERTVVLTIPYTQVQLNTWQASQLGLSRLHFILRFRQLLQFMASFESLPERRTGSLSILICGLDIIANV